MELAQALEPGKVAKTDKTSIISDAIKMVTQLRAENGQLKQLNKFLEVGPPPWESFPEQLEIHRTLEESSLVGFHRLLFLSTMASSGLSPVCTKKGH